MPLSSTRSGGGNSRLGVVKRFLDFLTNSPAAVTFAVLTVLGIGAFVIPGLHSAAWIIGLGLCLGVIVALQMVHGEWRGGHPHIDSLRQQVSVERGDRQGAV